MTYKNAMTTADSKKIDDRSVIAAMDNVLSWEAACIEKIRTRLNQGFVPAVSLLRQCEGRVIVSGMGKMGWIARKAAATFCSTGTPALFLHPSEAQHGDLGIVSRGDVFLALSNSGETAEIVDLLPFMLRNSVDTIALTGRKESALARKSQVVLDISVEREADPITSAPTASTTVALAVCDALAVALMTCRGFTAEQFAIFHPGGFLGKKLLLTVGELMHIGDRIPIAAPTSRLREAIVVMSNKALGCVFVIDSLGKLLGIMTDGDLRRSLTIHSNPLDDRLAQHMTASPRFVTADTLAAEAIRLMEQHSITVLPVLNSDKVPVGAIHLHDLVQAGLA